MHLDFLIDREQGLFRTLFDSLLDPSTTKALSFFVKILDIQTTQNGTYGRNSHRRLHGQGMGAALLIDYGFQPSPMLLRQADNVPEPQGLDTFMRGHVSTLRNGREARSTVS
jgi:hypothetical protein